MPPSQSDAILCLYRTALACMLPFFIAGAHGDAELASNAIFEMVSAYRFATAVELDLVGRVITFSAAAMDSLRLSMQPNLSDAKITKYRAAAIALNRSAEQCRKTLEAIQLKREQYPARAAPSRPIPAEATAPIAPPPPSEVPRAQAKAPPSEVPRAQANAPARPIPAADESDRFEADVEAMRLDALAMIANLRAMEQMTDAGAFQGSLRAAQPDAVPRNHPATTGTAPHRDTAA